jgi:phosphoglucomutase
MATHALAGKPVPADLLIDVSALEKDYFQRRPDLDSPQQRVSFGTSGHRGTSTATSFNEAHILAIVQAICEYRSTAGISGPLFLGKDTHALSEVAQRTALEVLAGNNVIAFVQREGGFTPTPAVSRAILVHNRDSSRGLADGIVITPSHNPPADGGIKYNPPHGGPADTDATRWIQTRANELLGQNNNPVKRLSYEAALRASTTYAVDLLEPYVRELIEVVDLEAIRSARIKIGVDPLGGAAVHYWEPIQRRYRLDLTVVNRSVDPTFRFMTLDHDGRIRMDCSSPFAMATLIELKNRFQVAFGNDPDADRHGIVTPTGLMNPNHYLAAAIHYLVQHRPQWAPTAAIGKTVVSSSLIDRIVASLDRTLMEVPVGFKYFAPGLHNGSVCFGGEESAGASFLRRNGQPWSTDKDGLILGLLAAEITAVTGKDPATHYLELASKHGTPFYARIDAPASPEQKAAFSRLTPESVGAQDLAGDPVTAKLTHAPGNNEPIGGLKVITRNGWFAARPSGTENLYKLYAESFVSDQHLQTLVSEAQSLLTKTLGT